MNIKDYCEKEGLTLSAFARIMQVTRQDVNLWIKKDWFIHNGWLNSPKREIKKITAS
jgi:hypothetical protein